MKITHPTQDWKRIDFGIAIHRTIVKRKIAARSVPSWSHYVNDFLLEYGLFLAKTLTLLAAIAVVAVVIIRAVMRDRWGERERLDVRKLNHKYRDMALCLKSEMLPRDEFKKLSKEEKKHQKANVGKTGEPGKRIFVLNFEGDIRASAIACLREEITAILTVASTDDEVFIRLNSGGGLVHSYGLAASQLARIRKRGIPLTVAVDKVAASGGYMMACVANRIIAAPFSVLGSIGVLAQLPNFSRLLKKHDIDYEQFTAGEFKRTVTMFGENTDAARAKFRNEIEETHQLFKNFVTQHRPIVDIARVATGEHWHGIQALELNLVDELLTSDDYLLEHSATADLLEVTYTEHKPLSERLSHLVTNALNSVRGHNANNSAPERLL